MYIFRMPKDVPTMTYAALSEYIDRGRRDDYRMIGATVQVHRAGAAVEVWLYNTLLATVTPTVVVVGGEIDQYVSNATREWLQLVLRDNGIRGLVGAEQGRYRQTGQTYYIDDEVVA